MRLVFLLRDMHLALEIHFGRVILIGSGNAFLSLVSLVCLTKIQMMHSNIANVEQEMIGRWHEKTQDITRCRCMSSFGNAKAYSVSLYFFLRKRQSVLSVAVFLPVWQHRQHRWGEGPQQASHGSCPAACKYADSIRDRLVGLKVSASRKEGGGWVGTNEMGLLRTAGLKLSKSSNLHRSPVPTFCLRHTNSLAGLE